MGLDLGGDDLTPVEEESPRVVLIGLTGLQVVRPPFGSRRTLFFSQFSVGAY